MHTNIFANKCKLHKFALPIVIFLSSFRHALAQYVSCISIFSKIELADQSKLHVQTIKRKLHKFATTSNNLEKYRLLQTCDIRTRISVFSKIELVDQLEIKKITPF